MWRADPSRAVFAHFSPMGSSRIDRIYATKEPSDKKIGAETGSSLHRPPIIRNAALRRCTHRAGGKGVWEMNTSILSKEAFKERLSQNWAV